MTDFNMLGLLAKLLRTLNEQQIEKPTLIQARAIPEVMNGRDVMGLAKTGTGKTLAFGLPLLHLLFSDGEKSAPRTARSLILAPTRELVNQIADHLLPFVKHSHIKLTRVVGGVGINPQIKRLERGTDLLVATPGRLIDLIEQGAVSLDETTFLVLDEADQMLDMGFIHALKTIVPMLPEERQTMLFSATMDKKMNEISKSFLKSPVRIEVSPPGQAADKIAQEVHYVPQSGKSDLLKEHLALHEGELALVFSRTKHGAERLSKSLQSAGFKCGSIHGNKSQGQRERTLKEARDGKIDVLVATDVAARGIDIPLVRFVYNYDIPNVTANFVHRIGRTARAGRDGRAIAYVSPTEISDFKAVEVLMKVKIPVATKASWAEEGAMVPEQTKPSRGGPRRHSRGGASGEGRFGKGSPAGGKKAGGPRRGAGGKPSTGGKRPQGAGRKPRSR